MVDNKIISLKKAKQLSRTLRLEDKKIVLVGGCFDILHLGHLKFLEAAKREGSVLIVALESDENVRRLKGRDRPVNPQKDRASLLAGLEVVDYILLLPEMEAHEDYFNLVKYLKPDVIAVTAGDPNLAQKRKQTKMVGGKFKIVISRLKTVSTSRLVKILDLN